MDTTLSDKKIFNCEIKYSKCFSNFIENNNSIRFRDNLLKEMYYHNFTLIKNCDSEDELYNIISNEIDFRKKEKENFCNIVSFIKISGDFLKRFKNKPTVSLNGFYLFENAKKFDFKGNNDCEIKEINNLKMIKESLKMDLEYFNGTRDEDFTKKRSNRFKDVYLNSKNISSFGCYNNGELIGLCDLNIFDDVAKIENFVILQRKQHQGFGTSILRHLINIAIEKNISAIYLVTDESETAKEMYLKLGFNKIGEKTDLFFEL